MLRICILWIVRGFLISDFTSSNHDELATTLAGPEPLHNPNARSKQLGQACSANEECIAAFSACIEATCNCRPGLTANKDGVCIPKNLGCPFGEPHRTNSSGLIRCEIKASGKPALTLLPADTQANQSKPPVVETCADGYYCQLPLVEILQGAALNSPAGQLGYCCPRPAAFCPIGQPAENASCERDGSKLVEKSTTRCDLRTHFCLETTLAGQMLQSTCCPRACGNSDIQRGGKCFSKEMKRIGDACSDSDGCPPGSECNNSTTGGGRCQCLKGYKYDSKANFCSAPKCPNAGGDDALPINDMHGDPVLCEDKACPPKSYCAPGDRVCCPIPPPLCKAAAVFVYTSDRCSLTDSGACSGDKTCVPWYSYWEISPGSAPSGRNLHVRGKSAEADEFSGPRVGPSPGSHQAGQLRSTGLCCPKAKPQVAAAPERGGVQEPQHTRGGLAATSGHSSKWGQDREQHRTNLVKVRPTQQHQHG